VKKTSHLLSCRRWKYGIWSRSPVGPCRIC